jgi:hypothetical protein
MAISNSAIADFAISDIDISSIPTIITIDNSATISVLGQQVVTEAEAGIDIDLPGNMSIPGQSVSVVETAVTLVSPENSMLDLFGQGLSIVSGRVLEPTDGLMSAAGQQVSVSSENTISIDNGVASVIGQTATLSFSTALSIGNGSINMIGSFFDIPDDTNTTSLRDTVVDTSINTVQNTVK